MVCRLDPLRLGAQDRRGRARVRRKTRYGVVTDEMQLVPRELGQEVSPDGR